MTVIAIGFIHGMLCSSNDIVDEVFDLILSFFVYCFRSIQLIYAADFLKVSFFFANFNLMVVCHG